MTDQSKVASLNNTLKDVENTLLKRALDRRDGQLDNAAEFINKLSDDGVIDIEGDDDPEDGEAGE